MSRTFRMLVAKAILSFTSTTAGAAVVSQSKTLVVEPAVNRPLLAQANAEVAHTTHHASKHRLIVHKDFRLDSSTSLNDART
jgi:hypothetical protein